MGIEVNKFHRYHTLEQQLVIQQVWLKRAQEELKTYVKSSGSAFDDDKVRSLGVMHHGPRRAQDAGSFE